MSTMDRAPAGRTRRSTVPSIRFAAGHALVWTWSPWMSGSELGKKSILRKLWLDVDSTRGTLAGSPSGTPSADSTVSTRATAAAATSTAVQVGDLDSAVAPNGRPYDSDIDGYPVTSGPASVATTNLFCCGGALVAKRSSPGRARRGVGTAARETELILVREPFGSWRLTHSEAAAVGNDESLGGLCVGPEVRRAGRRRTIRRCAGS